MPSIIERHPDWYQRLETYVASTARMAFEPGAHDCGLYAATGIMVQSKDAVDFAGEFRGRYTTLEEGLNLLHTAGYADHLALAADKMFEIPVAFARIGDLAAVDFGNAGKTLMIVGGQHLVGPMMGMRGSRLLTDATRAFTPWWQP